MKHVVNYSGGLASWAAALRVVEKYGTDDVVLLFADTKMEDADLYRFLRETSEDIGVPVTYLADGRTPWQVFFDVKYLGNTRIDPCSRILKRDLLNKWIDENCRPEEDVIYVGLMWDEGDRLKRHQRIRKPWRVEAPMYNPPYLTKKDLEEQARERGIEPPRLYKEGFPHNNCGGFCIKAGQGQFKLLYEKRPEEYLRHEAEEERFREYVDKDVAILRDRRGGTVKPLTLRELRRRIECGEKDRIDGDEWGGCGCAIDD